MGIATVFKLCVVLLSVDYMVAAYMGLAVSTQAWSMWLTVGFHTALLLVTLLRASRVDPNSHSDITGFYMGVWKLFYAEYLVLPFLVR